LPGGVFTSSALGVSSDGSVVVGYGHIDDNGFTTLEAFRWTSGDGMVGLGDLPGGPFTSQAFGVSGDGSTVVGYGSSANSGEAFRWTATSGMVGLGALPGGQVLSQAYGVSADGSVVVGTSDSASGNEAFRWTSGGGMERLWDVLVANGVDPAADGWTVLSEATHISADGNTIVGNGIRNGNTEAFLAVIPIVPEPSSVALLGLASLSLLRRRRSTRAILCITTPPRWRRLWAKTRGPRLPTLAEETNWP
jgi:probable HAF family extracellular repeat protein